MFYRISRHYAILASLILAALLIPCAGATQAASLLQDDTPAQPPSPQRGKLIYQANCAACHGDQGLGNGPAAAKLDTPPAQFADAATARQETLAQWFRAARDGRMEHGMPPWGEELDSQSLWDVVAYAWTLHLNDGELDQGKEVYQANCARCHGEAGRGDGPQAPVGTANLAAPETFDHSLAEWSHTVTAGQGNMPAFGDSLSEEQRWSVLEYARTLAFSGQQQPLTYQPGDGVIRGIITNGTLSQTVPAGITVTLHVFDNQSFDEVRQFETVTQSDGSFRFGQLSTSPQWTYLATLHYADVPYASGVGRFTPGGDKELHLPITIYEPTQDASGIRIEHAHWFIDFNDRNLLVGELYILSQDGNRTYVGTEEATQGRRITLRFPLPPGYDGVKVDPDLMGQRFFVIDDALVDTLPVLPGQGIRQILLSYKLPYSTDKLDLQHPILYPTKHLNVLVSDVGVKMSSPQVTFRDKRGDSGQSFLNFTGDDLAAGQVVTLSFDHLPLDGASSADSMRTVSAIAGAATVVIAALGLLIYASRRKRTAVASSPLAEALPELEAERQRLILAIARLDDAFDAGNIEEDVYQEERAAKKARLLEITRQIQEQREP
ncbi:MAG: c-type cytochrome [Anaerolineae bacterium]|nr:c-type cytochrome [Anaerolineae bacterium]